MRTPGQKAYEATQKLGWISRSAWDELTPQGQAQWERIAESVVAEDPPLGNVLYAALINHGQAHGLRFPTEMATPLCETCQDAVKTVIAEYIKRNGLAE